MLQQLVLYGQSEHKIVTKLAPCRIPALNAVAAEVQRVSIYVTQQPMFKSQMKDILELLFSVYRQL